MREEIILSTFVATTSIRGCLGRTGLKIGVRKSRQFANGKLNFIGENQKLTYLNTHRPFADHSLKFIFGDKGWKG